MPDDELPRPKLHTGALVVCAFAAIGFGTVVGGLYMLVAWIF